MITIMPPTLDKQQDFNEPVAPSSTQQDFNEPVAPPSTPTTNAPQSFFGHQVSSGDLGKGGRKLSDHKPSLSTDKALKGVSRGSIKKRRITTGHKQFLDPKRSASTDYLMQALHDLLGERSEKREGAGKLELTELNMALGDIQ